MVVNPYEQINDRFDKIESILLEIKSDRARNPAQNNPLQRLTRRNIRDEYKVSYATIHKLMRNGDLLYDKVGRKTLFVRKNVEACFSSGEK